MSKKLVDTLVQEGKIKVISNTEYSFTCLMCEKLIVRNSLKNLYSHTKRFTGFCKTCKAKKHFIEKYGVENPFQSEEIKEKIKKTNLEKFGVPYPIQNKEVIEKQTQTNLERYGVERVLQLNTFLEKVKQTNTERYGCENVFQDTVTKEKIKKTNIKKYGVENPSQSKEVQTKMESTCLERYGVKKALQLESFKEKSKQTCLERYGYENYSMTNESSKRKVTKYLYDNLSFDSSWELSYYIYCVDHDIPIEVHPRNIPYMVNNETHYYTPDFKVHDSTLIEIKGEQFFNENNELINPYNTSEKESLRNRAKQKCMKENKVKVLRKSDLVPIFEYLSTTYGKNYLNQYKVKKG